MKIDKKNCEIMQILHTNSRTPLTRIAREVGLSVDAVNRRISKMIEAKVFAPTIILRNRYCGFNNVVDVKIRLKSLDDKALYKKFISYIKEHPRVTEAFSVSGEYDLSLVIIARDALDLGSVTGEIRSRFGKLISTWTESLTIEAHKFEKYDFKRLFDEK